MLPNVGWAQYVSLITRDGTLEKELIVGFSLLVTDTLTYLIHLFVQAKHVGRPRSNALFMMRELGSERPASDLKVNPMVACNQNDS